MTGQFAAGKTTVYYSGHLEEATREYERFRGSFAQLLDDTTMVGDVENRWVIFKDGWVYGFATYDTKDNAVAFARQIFRDEPETTFIVTCVNADLHEIDGLHMLASALSDADGFDISTAPDELNRTREDADPDIR